MQALPCGLFTRVNSFGRAHAGASAALRASFGVNGILVAFGDGAYRALVDASTACNAIVTNYVSHDVFSLIVNVSLFTTVQM